MRSQEPESRSRLINQSVDNARDAVRDVPAPVQEVREMLLAVTRSLVDDPDHISVNTVSEGESVTFWVYAHPTDIGKLIGVSGRIARALRVILQANAAKLRLRLMLNICPTEAAPLESFSTADGAISGCRS